MKSRTQAALVAALDPYERLAEIGIGRRTDVAAALAASGTRVVATDVHRRSVPDGVRFVRDDVTRPDPSVYTDVEAIYALNLPPELHRPAWSLARRTGADFLFTTLGGDAPEVPVSRHTLPGETLFVAER
ncbi:UPF0146 family protein [Halalkalicoccus ordinarius]|uniref:UPF0146 family protein n=1 Tax=Halalkalicoccus ordinarius TaxID=3116651 RepID=UPI00300EE826